MCLEPRSNWGFSKLIYPAMNLSEHRNNHDYHLEDESQGHPTKQTAETTQSTISEGKKYLHRITILKRPVPLE